VAHEVEQRAREWQVERPALPALRVWHPQAAARLVEMLDPGLDRGRAPHAGQQHEELEVPLDRAQRHDGATPLPESVRPCLDPPAPGPVEVDVGAWVRRQVGVLPHAPVVDGAEHPHRVVGGGPAVAVGDAPVPLADGRTIGTDLAERPVEPVGEVLLGLVPVSLLGLGRALLGAEVEVERLPQRDPTRPRPALLLVGLVPALMLASLCRAASRASRAVSAGWSPTLTLTWRPLTSVWA
jgi:hypothetical protein